ncbi:unnamed protein product [Prunus armeniaca]
MKQLTFSMDLLEEHKLRAVLYLAIYQQLTARNKTTGTLRANWEGPYQVIYIARLGMYRLAQLNGKKQPYPRNVEHLRKYYPYA